MVAELFQHVLGEVCPVGARLGGDSEQVRGGTRSAAQDARPRILRLRQHLQHVAQLVAGSPCPYFGARDAKAVTYGVKAGMHFCAQRLRRHRIIRRPPPILGDLVNLEVLEGLSAGTDQVLPRSVVMGPLQQAKCRLGADTHPGLGLMVEQVAKRTGDGFGPAAGHHRLNRQGTVCGRVLEDHVQE